MITQNKNGYIVTHEHKQFGPFATIDHAREMLATLEYNKYEKVLTLSSRK